MSSGSQPDILSLPPDPNEWLTVKEAVDLTEELMPLRRRPNRSLIHRWGTSGKIVARLQGDRFYIHRPSLVAYCSPRPVTPFVPPKPSDTKNADDAVKRMSRRHGVRTPKKGGDTR